jgi:hypothetical protein
VLGHHLVEHAPKRPDIALSPVRTIIPDLWRRVIRRPSLSRSQIPMRDLRDVHIADLNRLLVAGDEHIRALEIAVQDFQVVQRLQPPEHLDQVAPALLLGKVQITLLVLLDLLQQVATLREFHDDAQRGLILVVECLFVLDNVFVVDRG